MFEIVFGIFVFAFKASHFCSIVKFYSQCYSYSYMLYLFMISFHTSCFARGIWLITPRMRARGKVIVLYVCRHEIRQFAESTHLIYAYASQFSRCMQKMSFIILKSFDIAQECHEQHLVLSHCCHAHILFYLKCFSHASQKCKKAFA